MIDSTFAQEIKAYNSDGSRVSRIAMINKVAAAAAQLSTPNVREVFRPAIAEHGRGAVGLCVADTMVESVYRLSDSFRDWAVQVLALWRDRPAALDRVCIRDDLHPSRIEDYAGSLVRATTVV